MVIDVDGRNSFRTNPTNPRKLTYNEARTLLIAFQIPNFTTREELLDKLAAGEFNMTAPCTFTIAQDRNPHHQVVLRLAKVEETASVSAS